MKSKGFQGRREYPKSIRKVEIYIAGIGNTCVVAVGTRVEMDAGQSPLDLILLSID